ncbi:hypothetical protein POSPLADRAFT_1126972 [Postia placenta MAD-698-R-SB12]|uniref:Enoyl-CoA hydratase n=1 Tax=Postia placenta MAD-698-R-SB12 TaxID=670580 RepID=A0A1X6NHK6_9APHY|nr:hypothetical protein POSPLADRAFT_1126972 [Postia placenta MAD-698-R-SB12]OSX68128.1 hypothetical protein POSPLADRAFT_1126972 [Postia placenta MAD-698-R-SB12]
MTAITLGEVIGVWASAYPAGPAAEPARRALQLRPHIRAFQHSIAAVERCLYPVIAAALGIALGLDIDIVSAFDVRYAASNAVFVIKKADVGLAADIGTLARLPKIAGNQSLVHELAYTARNFSADEAERTGFVLRVVSGRRDVVVRAALALAGVIAQKSPVAVLATKHLLVHARDHSLVAEDLDCSVTWNSTMLQTADMKESLRAVKAKERPQYAKLLPKP